MDGLSKYREAKRVGEIGWTVDKHWAPKYDDILHCSKGAIESKLPVKQLTVSQCSQHDVNVEPLLRGMVVNILSVF